MRNTSFTAAGNSGWTPFIILATEMSPILKKYEYSSIYARGTGAKNHDSSIIKIDNNIVLDSAYFRGLYLAIFNRVTLKKEFSKIYDTQ